MLNQKSVCDKIGKIGLCPNNLNYLYKYSKVKLQSSFNYKLNMLNHICCVHQKFPILKYDKEEVPSKPLAMENSK
jgi:hypothetical protein